MQISVEEIRSGKFGFSFFFFFEKLLVSNVSLSIPSIEYYLFSKETDKNEWLVVLQNRR